MGRSEERGASMCLFDAGGRLLTTRKGAVPIVFKIIQDCILVIFRIYPVDILLL